ncbi:MAG: ACP S-malonyltransferase [Bacteroidota bacterium]
MNKAYIFPGQGAQFPGMGKALYENHQEAKDFFNQANEILNFDIKKIMFTGSAQELKQTKVTQPAIFIHSVVAALTSENFQPQMVAGHSLGEFSALVANQTLSFKNGLSLVSKRAFAMQKACEMQGSTMAAVLDLDDVIVEEICDKTEGVVVAANYNCLGQVVISGEANAVEKACESLKKAGARRALILPVGGAFHSPLMESAREELAHAIKETRFNNPTCPIYQNVDANGYTDIELLKNNLVKQLTSPVRWVRCVQNMIRDGADLFIECGPGKVLQGLIKKIDRNIKVQGIS